MSIIGMTVIIKEQLIDLCAGCREEETYMTTLYFIRHAEPDYSNHNDRERTLTQKGKEDRTLVTNYLSDKNIDVVLSSPYARAVDTVKHFADTYGYSIGMEEAFRERKIDSVWIEDFTTFTKMQWNDFNYKLSDGECLREVQVRNIQAVMKLLRVYEDKNIVIGSHGTALSTILNYFNPSFSFEEFQRIRGIMPWIVKITFRKDTVISIEEIDVSGGEIV